MSQTMIGRKCRIRIKVGLESKIIRGTVIEYLGNDQYVIEGENGNRYTRVYDEKQRLGWAEVSVVYTGSNPGSKVKGDKAKVVTQGTVRLNSINDYPE